ncbi:MAG: prepilin-type cleavage/methylation domain-containing protein, partial [Verminephrobacter sp.]|nr:prepilin-type cleavage/methylation domain-containing protein [Verminephrobacter sp.]
MLARPQRGVTLVELLVGLTIGLLTIAVAMGALMVSRGVSGTVSDASGIQQQAAYAMRVIGMQVRQAGSLRLNLNPGTSTAAEPYLAAVAFETTIPAASSPLESFDPAQNTINGTASPVSLTVGFRRYTEPVFTNAAEQSLSRNCLGGPDDSTTTHQRLESIFALNGSELRCNGNGAGAQPIVQNVANFQVRYQLQDNATTPGISTLKSVDASGVTSADWGKVQAVEVCLVLYGDEAIDLPAGSNYTDCDGATVDMSTLTGARARRMHVPFRNTFQLRSQGLVGSVL